MTTVAEFLQSSNANDQQCLICRNAAPASPEKFGKFFQACGQRVWLCTKDATPFLVGQAIGSSELNGNIVRLLMGLGKEDTGDIVRAKIIKYVPDAARQLFERDRWGVVAAISPRTLFEGLAQNVVGQDEAKRQVSVAVFDHLQRLTCKDKCVAPPKSHVLLLGPSGVGKTLLAHSTGELLSLPFASTDATGFSPTGFVGGDAESCIHDLLVKTHGIVEAAERGVVLIDEIDKLASVRGSHNAEHLNASTQGTLLRLIEGKEVKVPATLFGEPMGTAPVPVSTANMLFFLGGAFPGLPEVVGRVGGYNGRKIGLRGDDNGDAVEEAIRSHEILASADYDTLVQALIEYGMGAELIGRIPTIAPLAPLTRAELRKCLLDVPHSPLRQRQHVFEENGYTLIFEETLIEQIVATAHKKATGTRALQSLVSRATSRAAFDLLGNAGDVGGRRTRGGGTVTLTSACLNDPSGYQLTRATLARSRERVGKASLKESTV